jgi:hypothetical protein
MAGSWEAEMAGEGAPPGRVGAARGFPRRGPRPLAAARLAFVLSLMVLLGACGIEEYVYLLPPTIASPTSITPLDIVHNISNDSASFLGYEIYYRLFDADVDSASYAEWSACSSKIDAYFGVKSPSELKTIISSLGFQPMVGLDKYSALANSPLLAIANADILKDISFILSVGPESSLAITGDYTPSDTFPTQIRRSSKNPSGDYRTFADLSSDKDSDTAYEGDTPPTEVLFRAYIVAYGFNFSSGGSIYSIPIEIGDDSTILYPG